MRHRAGVKRKYSNMRHSPQVLLATAVSKMVRCTRCILLVSVGFVVVQRATTAITSYLDGRSMVKSTDYIYTRDWDSAPIVIESHKLVFFTVPKVGCTIWKRLFRRMMKYDNWHTLNHITTHDPNANGLKYLYDYPLRKAHQIMTSPKYTRAIFVRDPKERFLSAYLDKAVGVNCTYLHSVLQHKCCLFDNNGRRQLLESDSNMENNDYMNNLQFDDEDEEDLDTARTKNYQCLERACSSLENFYKLVSDGCWDPHWRPQQWRIDDKFWPYINFVGHMETQQVQAKLLLQKVSAWDEFGKTGWGPNGDLAVFETPASKAVQHSTSAHNKLKQYFGNNNDMEQKVMQLYRDDYDSPWLNFSASSV